MVEIFIRQMQITSFVDIIYKSDESVVQDIEVLVTSIFFVFSMVYYYTNRFQNYTNFVVDGDHNEFVYEGGPHG